MKPQAMKREEANVRAAMRDALTAEQQLKVLAQRPGNSKKEVKRLSKGAQNAS